MTANAYFMNQTITVYICSHALERIDMSGMPREYFLERLMSRKASLTQESGDRYTFNLGNFDLIYDSRSMTIVTVICTCSERKHSAAPKLGQLFKHIRSSK